MKSQIIEFSSNWEKESSQEFSLFLKQLQIFASKLIRILLFAAYMILKKSSILIIALLKVALFSEPSLIRNQIQCPWPYNEIK